MKRLHVIYLTFISLLIIGSSFSDKDDDIVCIQNSNENGLKVLDGDKSLGLLPEITHKA